MKKIIFIISGAILVAMVFFVARSFRANAPIVPPADQTSVQNPTSNENSNQSGSVDAVKNNSVSNGFQSPLDRAKERVTKKPFGIFITPQNSPVQPEKFRGYHTGTDFEIFPEELNADVPVVAVCDGKLLMKKYATGYGGVTVQECTLDGQVITVVYGHLKLASVAVKIGDDLKAGDQLGILGAAYSAETNGERKHLHLGFHKGIAINILGYVQNKTDLSGWLDLCQYVCQ
jgi:murein DD-endopeptidase MepM/ murein hydrolase activator NlpD